MTFLSFEFYLFLPVFLVFYFLIPQKYRYIIIFLGSYYFYGFLNFKILYVMGLVTAISYFGGLLIYKYKTKKNLALFFALDVLVLVAFKYNCYNLSLPIGLSFIVFQSCTYLTDVYRNNIDAERNILRYGAFVAFFPTVLSGPIQKSRNLLPQIKNPKPFDSEEAKKGTILFIWGLFEKIIISNKLSYIVNTVYGNYENYNSAYYIIAAVGFSLYIYADFSSYSDMARGVAKLLGIDIGINFKNPYLSKSTSEFWNRWHISLNTWLIENVYIPLGGNRRGTLRKYINMLIVFFISGLWHGDKWHFVIWGVLNGIIVIMGQITKPLRTKVYQTLNVDESLQSIVFIKQVIVFVLITITWVPFRNGVKDSLYIIKNIVLFNPINFFDYEILNIAGTTAGTLILLFSILLFCKIQLMRQNEHEEFVRFSKQPMFIQCLCMALIITVSIFGICQASTDTASVNSQFMYFQF